MSLSRLWKKLIALTLAASAPHLHGESEKTRPSTMYYPQSALAQIYTQKQLEQKRADDLERKAVEQRDLYDRQRQDVERQIAAHRYHIEGLKIRQEKAQSELEMLSVDLQHVNGDLASYQSEHQELKEASQATMEYLSNQKMELSQEKKDLDLELKNLADTRKKAEREIYLMGMDILRYKVDIAKIETKIQESKAERSLWEAEELRVRGEWADTKLAVAEQNRLREEASAELKQAKAGYDQAQKELSEAKVELAKAEKKRNSVTKNVMALIEGYERDTLQAARRRIANENKRMLIESEMVKLHDYATHLGEYRDQNDDQRSASENVVFRSSLALESAKSELSTSIEKSEQELLKADLARHQARSIAAADRASVLLEGSRIWTTVKRCRSFAQPGGKSPQGYFDSGKRLLGKDRGNRWVEVMNGTGESVYIESHCGKYEH